MRIVFSLVLIVLVLYGIAEWRRWQAPDMRDLLTRGQRARRAVIFVAMLIVVGMAVGGTFFPTSHISRVYAAREMIYWMVCIAIFALVPFILLWEFRVTVKQGDLLKMIGERDEAYRQMVESVVDAEQKAVRREELPRRNGHS